MTDDHNWVTTGTFRHRAYNNYEDYLAHQVAKLATIKGIEKHNLRFREALLARFDSIPNLRTGATVLCLAARTGAECEAFVSKGCVAIGIDLNPGANNKYVVTGDFHRLQYADNSFDFVYTNSLDHVFDLERVLNEVSRVLKSDGTFIAEIMRGSFDAEGREPGSYESIWWERNDLLIETISKHGFVPSTQRVYFTYPWNGDQVIFRKVIAKAAQSRFFFGALPLPIAAFLRRLRFP